MKKRSDIAFTAAVKAAQRNRGSRAAYEKAIARRDWPGQITDELAAFISERDSLYLGTASAAGRPYIQHRGGPRGFIKILDESRLAIPDYRGNQQYISLGNLSENNKAFLFLIDYPSRRRIKLWGTASFADIDERWLSVLVHPTYAAKLERVLLFDIETWNENCQQHITRRYTAEPNSVLLEKK